MTGSSKKKENLRIRKISWDDERQPCQRIIWDTEKMFFSWSLECDLSGLKKNHEYIWSSQMFLYRWRYSKSNTELIIDTNWYWTFWKIKKRSYEPRDYGICKVMSVDQETSVISIQIYKLNQYTIKKESILIN